MKSVNRRRHVVLGVFLLVMAAIPSYIRAFVIAGDSDAPEFVTGDRVLVNLAAYDIRLPYAAARLARVADPAPGDMVLLRLSGGQLAVKRVVAGPGTQIAMRAYHLTINGGALEYAPVAPQQKAGIGRGHLGTTVEVERGNGPDVYISFDQGPGILGDLEARVVPEDCLFVLGANRDASRDSRHFGPLPRERVLGKVVGHVSKAG